MTTTIVIPVINRGHKLDSCLNSIFNATMVGSIDIRLFFTDPFTKEHYRPFLRHMPNITLHDLDWYLEPRFINRQLQDCTTDIFMWLYDDIQIPTGLFTELQRTFADKYPAYDGIVGFSTEGSLKRFSAIGMQYANNTPARAVLNTKYNMFYADAELQMEAGKHGKFTQSGVLVNGNTNINNYCHTDTPRLNKWLVADKKTFDIYLTGEIA